MYICKCNKNLLFTSKNAQNNRSPVPKSEKEHLKETIGTIILNII